MNAKQVKIKQNGKEIEAVVAENLKIMRKIRGLSLAEVGQILGCTGQQVQKYEAGKNKISIAILEKFAILTGVPISFFFEEIDWRDLMGEKE